MKPSYFEQSKLGYENGKWYHLRDMIFCSSCGASFYDDIIEYFGKKVSPYCPMCGAKMSEGCYETGQQKIMNCGVCDKTDGLIYCSLPPRVKCKITGKYHLTGDECDVEHKERKGNSCE